MRMFASDKVMKLIDKMGWEKGEMLEHSFVTNAIEKAQKRVEENNFGIRKRLLEYDDVMNKQRTYIYSRRYHALVGERIGIDIANMIYDTIENLVMTYEAPADYDDLKLEIAKIFTCEPPYTAEEYARLEREDKVERLHSVAMETLERRGQRIREVLMPVVNQALEHGESGVRSIPITDGKRIYPILFDLKEAQDTDGASIVKEWQKKIMLVVIDEFWKEHLRELDQLRQSVQNASYEQKDPLVIYKVESFHMFENMLSQLNNRAVSSLMRGQIFIPQRPPMPQQQPQQASQDGKEQDKPQQPQRQQPSIQRAMPQQRPNNEWKISKATLPSEEEKAQRAAASSPQGNRPQTPQPIKAAPKVGRNDPCPCGSGKKYKNCHGRGL